MLALRFRFQARDAVRFPAGKAGNVLRGAFGSVLREAAGEAEYQRLFEPRGEGPSGLRDRPRPFVFRAAHLDGRTVPPGEPFHLDVHLFDRREAAVTAFEQSFVQLGRNGFGPGRGRAEWTSTDRRNIHLTLAPEPAGKVRVSFLTPTELKGDTGQPEFNVLFARIRDRLSTLRALYGPGPLEIDFAGMGGRAGAIRTTHCAIRWEQVERLSSRTGQSHPLGGFTGEADYEGDLAEFVPYLRAAQWTGVGRQTVWGKGEIGTEVTG